MTTANMIFQYFLFAMTFRPCANITSGYRNFVRKHFTFWPGYVTIISLDYCQIFHSSPIYIHKKVK